MDSHKHSPQVCRLEVVDTGRCRRWSFEEKLRIVEESHEGHRQASATARRHGISRSLLFSCRRAFREGLLGVTDAPELVPAMVLRDPAFSPDAFGQHVAGKSASSGRMEIVMDPDCFVFIDETAAATNMARRYGRLPV